MIQAWITESGGPEVIEIRELPDPEPKLQQVLIGVEAIGINFADIMLRRGVYAAGPDLPAVPGYEVAGTVLAVGPGVDAFEEGDEVVALTHFGGYSSRACVATSRVWKRPAGMSAEEGAAMPVNYLTAFEALVVMGSLRRPDELGGIPTRVLVHGAAGGVGTAVADIGKMYDAELFGTASYWKHNYAYERGYEHLIDYHQDDFVEEVIDLTDGRGVDIVLDPIGGEHWRRSLEVLAPTGRLCVFGMSSVLEGPTALLKMLFKTPWWRFTPPYLMQQSLGVYGYFLGKAGELQEETRAWSSLLLKYHQEGKLMPHVHNTFALEQADEAHQYIEERKSIGKVLLKP